MKAASIGWSHSDWISLSVAVGTLFLGGATVWLGWVSRRAVTESARARVDARAPRLAVLTRQPEWPPRLLSTVAGGEPQRVDPGIELSEWSGAPNVVVLRTDVDLRNEGNSTAVVMVKPATDHGSRVQLVRNRAADELASGERAALSPGEEVTLIVDGWRPVGEWGAAWMHQDVEACKLALTIEVTDQFEDGILDTTIVEVSGLPVDDSSKTKGSWAVRNVRVWPTSFEGAPVKARALPTTRRYLSR